MVLTPFQKLRLHNQAVDLTKKMADVIIAYPSKCIYPILVRKGKLVMSLRIVNQHTVEIINYRTNETYTRNITFNQRVLSAIILTAIKGANTLFITHDDEIPKLLEFVAYTGEVPTSVMTEWVKVLEHPRLYGNYLGVRVSLNNITFDCDNNSVILYNRDWPWLSRKLFTFVFYKKYPALRLRKLYWLED